MKIGEAPGFFSTKSPPMVDRRLKHLIAADEALAKVISEAGAFTLSPPKSPNIFPALIRSIVHQQLSGKAAASIHARVLGLFGKKKILTPKDLLSVSDQDLRSAGLSHAKVLALRDLAEKALARIVPSARVIQNLSDEEIIERLTAVRGIGVWTVQMLLMFELGRLDVLPAHDLGVRKGFQHTMGMKDLPAPKYIEQWGERWRPYRSIASWYMWRAVDLHRSKNEGKERKVK